LKTFILIQAIISIFKSIFKSKPFENGFIFFKSIYLKQKNHNISNIFSI
jgi:hypothetical protein